MTYEQAVQFFATYGNVSRCVSSLRNGSCTPEQLEDACWAAIRKGQFPLTVVQAKLAVEAEINRLFKEAELPRTLYGLPVVIDERVGMSPTVGPRPSVN